MRNVLSAFALGMFLAACSDSDPLASLEDEWRMNCRQQNAGIKVSEQNGERYFAILGNEPAPVEHVSVDGNTIAVVAGDSRATITKISSIQIKVIMFGRELLLERCN